MSILFSKPGILTTVQDSGRTGLRRFGINPNGAMDKTAMRLINILLGNAENEAVLETHFPAPEIVFEENTIFAVGGADFSAHLNDLKIENWRLIFAEKGSVVTFQNKIFGNRAYFAVKGGFSIEKQFASASTNLTAQIGGISGGKIEKNDRIFFNRKADATAANEKLIISASLIPFYSRFPTVRVVAGAEFEHLTAHGEQTFLHYDFLVSTDSNRMGFRLAGEPIFLLDQKELVSAAVNFGTVQLLPDGQLIILMADHQTSGGYPRIGNIIETDLPLVAQLGANDRIAFHLISQPEAENILYQFETNLRLLKIGVRYAFAK